MSVLKYLLVVSALSCVFGRKHNARVIGGDVAPTGKFPYQVSLQQSNQHVCAGCILSNRWLLSAAHCLDLSFSVSALVGTNNWKTGGTKYEIGEIFIHEKFNPFVAWHDIALLQTKKEILFGHNAAPIALGRNSVGGGVDVLFSGWGMTVGPDHPAEEHMPVEELRCVKLKTIENSKCSETSFLPISPKQICTLTKKGEGACFGDSGGALVNSENNRLVGILSRGTVPDRCGIGTPDVYMRSSSYVDWIEKHTKTKKLAKRCHKCK